MRTDSLCTKEFMHVRDCKHLSVVIANSNRVLTYGVALEITDTMLPNCQFCSSKGKTANVLVLKRYKVALNGWVVI